jgi:uncharacterized protein DUF4177
MAEQTHEYTVMELEHHGSTKNTIAAQWTRQLNELAADGWRLFSIIDQRAAIFERSVQRPRQVLPGGASSVEPAG